MIDSEWFHLHRRKGYEDGLIQPSANAVFILGRKVPTLRKDAASIQASDIGAVGFFCKHCWSIGFKSTANQILGG